MDLSQRTILILGQKRKLCHQTQTYHSQGDGGAAFTGEVGQLMCIL
jgi:hypothetical protein